MVSCCSCFPICLPTHLPKSLHVILQELRSVMSQGVAYFVLPFLFSYLPSHLLCPHTPHHRHNRITVPQIVMEYCGAGSVSDIMRLRKKTLTEEEIATVLYDTLRGLEYLHLRRKIHRDIKAGNILLNTQGHAKLADFGVAGQLSVSVVKACRFGVLWL